MTLTEAFLSDTISPTDFDHRAHVAVAFDLLQNHDFCEAHALYVRHLKALTLRVGMPEKFNATITMAAMSLIAERMATGKDRSAEDFLSRHPDLLEPRVLTSRFSPERLSSSLAREVPLLPDRVL